jgi:hypothetical protein
MYGGYAYGTSGHIGSYAHSGRSAVTTLCTSRAGVGRTNHSGATTIPDVGTVGAVTTRMRTSRPDSGPVSLATTNTAGVRLFGMIRASAITTTTRVARTANGITRTGSTGFVGLSVAGHASPPAHPSVGQKMAIPGVATIVFNRHLLSKSFGSYRMTVVGMTVTIPKDKQTAPAGRNDRHRPRRVEPAPADLRQCQRVCLRIERPRCQARGLRTHRCRVHTVRRHQRRHST